MQTETSIRVSNTSMTVSLACLLSEASAGTSISTGKERDSESGNDYFGARYYASTMGRFLSPDPIYIATPWVSDPQQWNLYSYGKNNPLSITDPTGMDINLNCSSVGSATCQSTIGQLNNRQGGQFTIGRDADTGNLTSSGDGKNLSGREAELYHAITDHDYTSTIKLVSPDSSFIGDHFVAGGGYNVVNVSDLKAFGSANAALPGEILSHAGVEGFESLAQFGNLKSDTQAMYSAAHNFANQFFGDVAESKATPTGVVGANAGGAMGTYNFGRINVSVDVYLKFQTPQPTVSLPSHVSAIMPAGKTANLDHVSPTKAGSQ